jgi:hypothetical protein
MDTSQSWIILSIAVLAVAGSLVFVVSGNRYEGRLTPLAGLAFGAILAGLCLGEDRLLGYTLFGVGLVLAVIDMFRRTGTHTKSR